MPVYASGLSGQVGAVTAPSYGDSATVVTHFYEFLSEKFVFNPSWLDGMGLKAGQAYNRSARTVQSRFDVNGELVMEHTIGSAANAVADSMGFWWKHALGSAVTTPTVVLGTAFKQNHTNGSKAGLYATCQFGRPQISGVTVQPFTYTGVKVTGWEFTCSDNKIAELKVTCDGQTELTSVGLAAASYPTPNGLFAFSDASVMTIGGTASTSAGETTVAGGAALGSRVNGITITGSTPMKVDRYGLGNSGLKAEPIENAIPTITGTLSTEFFSRTELYDVFKTSGTTTLQVDFTKFDAAGLDANGVASGPNPYRLSFILPSVKFKTAEVTVGGPDVIPQQVGFQAYDDGSGTNPVIQVKLVSKESSAI
jgi:Phage tail tube protein